MTEVSHPGVDDVPEGMEKIRYDDHTVRLFVFATILWGIVGMAVGVVIALQLVVPETNFSKYFTFGRLRPVHTNAVIFAFAGNAIFACVYYSTQRLVKARMASDMLSKVHFWGWQAIIVAAAITLPLGFTQTKEYAELEWPIAIAIAVIWIVFAINFFWTLKNRREKHLYVALWFYIASIITVAVLHVVNNLVIPVGILESYSIFSGVHDAMIQWWYGHNAVAFVLTTPFLGLMYYFLPKAANRPIFSYKLSIAHFWSLTFIYIWAGPHHLHYTSLPEWAATLGMVFSIMLWMPSWGGMINGLFTLRGAWDKVRKQPELKFFVAGITFYGMATFEGPMMSIKIVNSLSHFTDWTIAHVHSAALGWNGFMIFGMIYWLIPKLWKTKLWSKALANAHFWLALVGILLYVIAMYSAGITQGLMWRAFDDSGSLMYQDFMDTVTAILPMYWVRLVGGSLYLVATCLAVVNLYMTIRQSKKEERDLSDPVALVPVPAWKEENAEEEAPEGVDGSVDATDDDEQPRWDDWLYAIQEKVKHGWHRALEGWAFMFTVLTLIAILIGSIVEIVPMFTMKSTVPEIESVEPYTPLELEGRDIYIEEGCHVCHSQMVRPMVSEIERYGDYSKPGEDVYEYPFLWGSKRTGPDLARVGGKYNHAWHAQHFYEPQSVAEDSIMPAYPWLFEDELDLSRTSRKLSAMQRLGVPYSDEEVENAEEIARAQAQIVAEELGTQDASFAGLENKNVIALIAYMQRLGTDIETDEGDQ